MKKAAKEEMVAAIRDVLRGQIYVSRDLAMRAFQKSLETPQQNRASVNLPTIDNLSDREMHVFQLIGSGLWHEKNRPRPESERQNDRDPPRKHQTQARPEFGLAVG
jgi:hypothetical protein